MRLTSWLGVAIIACGCNDIENPGQDPPTGEVWVTHQTPDSKMTILSFPGGAVLDTFRLPSGTLPHYTTWGDGDYAYVSGMGDGTLHVIHADSRSVVETFEFAPQLTHQARVSPDRTHALVSVISTNTVHKINVDEANGIFSDSGQRLVLPGGPICTIYRGDSQRAYVSMVPSGLAVVDVSSMTHVRTLATDGFIACGMIKASEAADHAIIAASGADCINRPDGAHCGRVYTLDMTKDTLIDRGVLGATSSWHSWTNTADETIGVGTSPFDDKVVLVDLTTSPVSVIETMTLDLSDGLDQPDAAGSGTPIRDNTVFASLRASGIVAIIDLGEQRVTAMHTLAAPVTEFHPVLCNGCAVHGISHRPTRR